MTNPVHLLSVAALLLAAFLIGAIVGTLARLIALRLGQKPAVAVAAPVEAAPAAPPLVAAPVIAPLPVAPTATAPPPAEVPVPDFAATLIALANETPPATFIEATKPRAELSTGDQSAVRPMPTLAPLPAVEPTPAMKPAHVAGETTSGVQVAAPQHDAPQLVDTRPGPVEQRTAEVILFPSASAAAEPAPERPTDMMVGGEAVAVVDTSDLAIAEPEATPAAPEEEPVIVEAEAEHKPAATIAHEDNFLFVGIPATPKAELVPAAAPKGKTETIPIPVIAANAAVGAVVAAELPVPEVIETAATPARTVELPAVDAAHPAAITEITESERVAPEVPAPTPAPEAVVEEPTTQPGDDKPVADVAPQPEVAPAPEAPAEQPAPAASVAEPIVVSLDAPLDEDAAMRAIEGNWSPRRTPQRRPARTAAEPDGANQAVAASARAVIAARRTAEAVIAEVAEVKVEAGRPVGLDAPRDGRKDDLTHIIGVLPVIETALNKLGIFHFDQMGALTDENIAWIEGHLGVPGRIGRELWREQARELSAVLRPKRVAES
jgi:predicted flap endonuclease-1-like 5' DNA nuclease